MGVLTIFVAMADEDGLLWHSEFWYAESPILKAINTCVIAFVAVFVPVYLLQIVIGTLMRRSHYTTKRGGPKA